MDPGLKSKRRSAFTIQALFNKKWGVIPVRVLNMGNDPGLNIALYTSSKVDKLLEEARGLVSREDRAKKYETFQKEIQADLPSIFLYSPSFIYILPKRIKGVDTEDIVTPSERFSNVYRWYIDTKYVWKILHKNN